MSKSDTVASYLMKITQIHDQLAAISEAVDDTKLVNVALNGFPRSWEPFVQGIFAQEKLSPFDRLWTDCTQEEARIVSRNGKQKCNVDENQALVVHTRKRIRGGSPEKEASPETGRKKDLSKINCFASHQYGHYASHSKRKGEGSSKGR
jgi:3-oxoacyl-ACP reductase-like protein